MSTALGLLVLAVFAVVYVALFMILGVFSYYGVLDDWKRQYKQARNRWHLRYMARWGLDKGGNQD